MQERHSKHNVTLRKYCATSLAVKENKHYILRLCIRSFRYPAFKARGPYTYFHLWPSPLCYIFPQYLISDTIFEKKVNKYIKRVFWFSLHLLSETFVVLGRISRNMIKKVYLASYKVKVILGRRKLCRGFVDIFYENSSIVIRVVPHGQKYGRNEYISCFSQFFEQAL
jgi:hypothetical protein